MAALTERVIGLTGNPNLQLSTPGREIVEGSQQVAESLGHNFISSEHLLLSWFKHPIAAKVLPDFPDRIIGTVEWLSFKGATLPEQDLLLPSYAEVMLLSAREAREVSSSHIGAAELFYGLSKDRDSLTGGILEATGLSGKVIEEYKLINKIRTAEVTKFNAGGKYKPHFLMIPSTSRVERQVAEDLQWLQLVRDEQGEEAWAKELGRMWASYQAQADFTREMADTLTYSEYVPLAREIDSSEEEHPLKGSVYLGMAEGLGMLKPQE